MNEYKLHGYITRLAFGKNSWSITLHDRWAAGMHGVEQKRAWFDGWDDADTLFVEGVADTMSVNEWVSAYAAQLEV
jgi:hypothetical protein